MMYLRKLQEIILFKNNGGPWGSGSGGSPLGDDLEEVLRKKRSQFQTLFNNKNPNIFQKSFLLLLLVVLLCVWASTGFYRVGEKQQAAILRFGRWTETIRNPGLHYHLPAPIEEVWIKSVTERRIFNVPHGSGSKFMLTQDLNILDVNMSIQWYIKDLNQYLFRVQKPENTLEVAAESVIREVIAVNPMEAALTRNKDKIARDVQELLQKTVDEYGIGVTIERVNLKLVEAPAPVIDAFRDVQSARADQTRMINEAKGYNDSVIPVARGEAQKIIQEASAFRDTSIAEAEGKAARFKQVLASYRKDPQNTRSRLYIECMEHVYGNINKIISSDGQQLPYMMIDALKSNKISPQNGS